MNNKYKTIIYAAVFVIVMAAAVIAYGFLSGTSEENSRPLQTEENQVLASDFTVTDINGNAVNLSDFKGKPVFLNFWASWCGPCQSEMPGFNNLYEKYKDDVAFVMVNLTDGIRETVDTANQFIAESKYTFPVYFDTEQDAAIAYSVMSIPATYFIDSEGYIFYRRSGSLTEKAAEQYIEAIVSQ